MIRLRRGSYTDSDGDDAPRQRGLEKQQIFRDAQDQLDKQIDDAVRTAKKLEAWKGADEWDRLHPQDQHDLMNLVTSLASGNRIISRVMDFVQDSQNRILRDQVQSHMDTEEGAPHPPPTLAEPVEPAKERMSTEIQRQSMETFHDSVFRDPRNFTHVLSVFYNKKIGPTLDRVASTRLELSDVRSGTVRTQSQRPQRLIIGSNTLIQELEEITSTSFGKVPAV
jgi:hypothetical protein